MNSFKLPLILIQRRDLQLTTKGKMEGTLPYALWSTLDCSSHGEAAATDSANPSDELIGLLQGSLAGEGGLLDSRGGHKCVKLS